MKKILFSIFFFFALSLCFPLPVFGAAMEVTVTITGVRSPERSAMLLRADRPNTEFAFPNNQGRIMVIRNSDSSVKATVGISGYVKKNSTVTFTIPYEVALAPYSVYLEIQATPENNPACKADCSVVTGWYKICQFYTSDFSNYSCQIATCNSSYAGCIAVDPAHVVAGFWRSPVLFTIN